MVIKRFLLQELNVGNNLWVRYAKKYSFNVIQGGQESTKQFVGVTASALVWGENVKNMFFFCFHGHPFFSSMIWTGLYQRVTVRLFYDKNCFYEASAFCSVFQSLYEHYVGRKLEVLKKRRIENILKGDSETSGS